MDSINVENLSPEQAFQLTKRDDFNKIFEHMTPQDKKIFLTKIKQRTIDTQTEKKVKENPIPSSPNHPKPKPGVNKTVVKKNDKVEATITEQAKSFTKGMVNWAKSGFKVATPEVYADRMAICRKCQFWKEIPGPIIGRCRKCGCTGAKQKLSTSKCPIGLWGSSTK